MSSLSVSHYQSLDSDERKSIMLSHKVNLVIIIFSLNCHRQAQPRSLFSPHRRVTQPRTKVFVPPLKARSKPWLRMRKPTGWRRRSEFLLEPDISYEGFEPLRYKTKHSQARTFNQEAEKETILKKKEMKLDNTPVRKTVRIVNIGRKTPHVGVYEGKTPNSHGMNYSNPPELISFENSTMKNRQERYQDERSQSENNDLNNYVEWMGWESRRL